MKKLLLVLSCVMSLTYICKGQDKEIDFEVKKTGIFTDEYKVSEALEAVSDNKGGVILGRSYGNTNGYLLEHYDAKMVKIKSYKKEIEKGESILGVMFSENVANFIVSAYDKKQEAYICYVDRGNVNDMKLIRKEILRINMKKHTPTILSTHPDAVKMEVPPFKLSVNKSKKAFGILTNIKAGKGENDIHDVYVFNNNLDLILKNTLRKEFKDDMYKVEELTVAEDGSAAYILGKTKAGKKRKKGAPEYYYDLTKITSDDVKMQAVDNHNYDESLKIILRNGQVVCVGFYSDIKEWQPAGIHYIAMDASSLDVVKNKLLTFTEDLKQSYGKKFDKEIAVFEIKGLLLTAEENVIFSAEQNESLEWRSYGGNTQSLGVNSEEYKDIMSVKLNSSGEIVWAKFINKHQNTTGVARDYLSFSAMTINDDVYYFINGILKSIDGGFRIAYRGLDNADFNVVKIDKDGNVKAQKLIDKSEVKVPFRATEGVEVPNMNKIFFLGRESKDKQLISVSF